MLLSEVFFESSWCTLQTMILRFSPKLLPLSLSELISLEVSTYLCSPAANWCIAQFGRWTSAIFFQNGDVGHVVPDEILRATPLTPPPPALAGQRQAVPHRGCHRADRSGAGQAGRPAAKPDVGVCEDPKMHNINMNIGPKASCMLLTWCRISNPQNQ